MIRPRTAAFSGAVLEIMIGIVGGLKLIHMSAPYHALGIALLAGIITGFFVCLGVFYKEILG